MQTLGVHELAERIDEILCMVEEEGETIEITNQGKVIAHLVPVGKPQSSIKHELTPFWEKMDRLASEIGKYLPDKVDAVEIVHAMRREI